MDDRRYLEALKEGILSLNYEKVTEAAREAIEAGVEPMRAITEGMAPGMAIVGAKFQTGEFFLSELVVAGDVMREGMKIINPHIKAQASGARHKMVLATVEGDNHDIGKSIVATLLAAQGFDVVDLGIDVSSAKIVEAVKEHRPAILGLSALLTVTMPKMGEVLEALKAAGVREHLKVIIGGTSVTPKFAASIGADHGSNNAVEGVERCVAWTSE